MPTYLGFDIGSNSVGSAWVDTNTGEITTGTSIFPAGVDESDDKRGDPKNAKRRMTRRTRITLRRRAQRKRELRLKLIEAGLLPRSADVFKKLLETTDAWDLRRKGLDEALTPHEFGRVLLHLAQRRGALGLKIADVDDEDGEPDEDGKVKAAIGEVRLKMRERKARTFGEFIAGVRAERVTPITTEDLRPVAKRKGPREFRAAVRNKAGNYEHCADRGMIRVEFGKLWDKQKELGGATSKLLTDELRCQLDNEAGDTTWRHKGLLFGQRRQSWDLGTLGRCVLEPTERCAPHADMYASRYLVAETINNLKIMERGKEPRPLTVEERQKIKAYLSGPLGMEKPKKKKGEEALIERQKNKVNVGDLRKLMGSSDQGWGERGTKNSQFRFNIETDENRDINTDWFSREIIHGAVTREKWDAMPASVQEGINRAILKFDPEQDGAGERLKSGVMAWAGLTEGQSDALVAAWKRRPKLDAKRLNMSRRAVRNILSIMEGCFTYAERADGELIAILSPKKESFDPRKHRWFTQIEARKAIAQDEEFLCVSTGQPLDELTRRRYSTGAKGGTARDRHYMAKHVLMHKGEPVIDPAGNALAEPPPAPLISNPVVRKAIHEVRRQLVEYMVKFCRKPDYVFIELAREARMGKKDADRLLFRNRLRNRIRNDILEEFDLHSVSATQQRAAVDRVVLAVQQGCVCPLCGKRMGEGDDGMTLRKAAYGEGCEVAHIIPRASGGHNGLGNIVLAHTKCNREMERRTPRQYWENALKGGFEAGIAWVEKMFTGIERPKDMKSATGIALWSCYFASRPSKSGPTYDELKILQFKKDIKDIQEMTHRQEAATKYATRQVMAYLADALYDGQGLPERGGDRRIFATDGMWTSRLRREWGLFFDPHDKKSKGLTNEQEHERKEKDRGDHRHHAIDAVVIALCDRSVQTKWEDREKNADKKGINTADEQQMENFRRENPIGPRAPFNNREKLRALVEKAVFGTAGAGRAICHRHVKRKLIGALHEETLFGPVLDRAGNLTGNYTAKKSVLALDPNHLRMPRPETKDEAIERLTARRMQQGGVDPKAAAKWARGVVASKGYRPAIVDPPPGKSGIVRDVALRARLRQCLTEAGLNPDDFSTNQIKKLFEAGGVKHASGVPIGSVVLLRTMSDPVIVSRKRPDYTHWKMVCDDDPASKRAYVGGNNHHIEIRVGTKKKGGDDWTGIVISAYEAAQRKLAKLRAVRKAGVPRPTELRKLTKDQRARFRPALREIERALPMVDRADNDAKGGRFVMSLCEGEMLMMRRKPEKKGELAGPVSYFVVAKLDKPNGIVLVPHWDARAAGERKDAEGKKVADSKREQFTVVPSDLVVLAPPDRPHAVKVRVSPLGEIKELDRD
jgi:CRISPR-associated endonuclease Csn1